MELSFRPHPTELRCVACVAVGVQPARVTPKVIFWPLALPVRRVAVVGGGRCGPGECALVAHLGPEPSGLRGSAATVKHRDGRGVGVGRAAPKHVPADLIHEQATQRDRLTDPVRERRARQLHALAREDLGLTVQRQMVGVFRDEDMREKARAPAAPLDRQGRHGRLRDRPLKPARQLRPHVTVHNEASGDVLQEFARVLAEGGA